jgi:proteasome activator subunit 4
VVFFYRNLLSISGAQARAIMDALLDCLADQNVEVREMASKALSGVVRCSQRQSIIPLKVCRLIRAVRAYRGTDGMTQNRFIALARKSRLPARRDPKYAEVLRALHSAILGLCALIESYPYTVETWMPPLTDGTVISNLAAWMCAHHGWLQCWPHTRLIRRPFRPRSGNAPPSSRRSVNR